MLLRHGPALAMLIPFAAVFAGFVIWPLLNSLYLAFTDFNGVTSPRIVGTDNFTELWFQDDRFRHALANTLLYVAATVILATLLALVLALAFHGTRWRDRLMRTLFLLPAITSTIALMLIWRWIFSTESFGLANTVLHWFGGRPVTWLATPSLAIPILVLIAVWSGSGYGMVIFSAGINAIPKEIEESAELDGATYWQRLRHITLPQLRPVTTYVVVTGLIGAFQVFEAVYIVFRGVDEIGGVSDSALMVVPYLYDKGFNQFKLGYASAIAWTLFVIVFAVGLIQLKLNRATKDL
jgi:multiple sugar transport system permease protein